MFSILSCGFVPRCTLDDPDAGEPRLRRIERMIQTSQYSIHDLSRVELTPLLPRFNMPFELGLDLGCRAFGRGAVKRKRCLILESKPYRYQELLSDIAGQDILAHANSPDELIVRVRNWLRAVSKRDRIAGPKEIKTRFAGFATALPDLCDANALDRDDLQSSEYVTLVEEWLRRAG